MIGINSVVLIFNSMRIEGWMDIIMGCIKAERVVDPTWILGSPQKGLIHLHTGLPL